VASSNQWSFAPSEIFSNHSQSTLRNRALSIRSGKSNKGSTSQGNKRGGFSFSSLRGTVQPELSRKLFRLIKSENNLINAHETAGRERISIATQLSEWGENTNDEAVSDISDKVGVILSEMGELEENYSHHLDDSRGRLKAIRNTEKSVQPSRDNKAKIADEIQKLKMKEPESAKLVVLEQELVRSEAENLVAEAQLSNVVRTHPLIPRIRFRGRTDKHDRPARSSRKHTKSSSLLPSSAPRSRSFLPSTAAACSLSSTTRLLYLAMPGWDMSTLVRAARSSTTPRMI
jgi:hypothetical protein